MKNAALAWGALFKSYRLLRESVEVELKKEKLPPLPWYDVLFEIDKAPDCTLRQYEIGKQILLNKHNLSRLIDRLDDNGYLTKNKCVDDKRGNHISITEKGKQTLKQMWAVYKSVIKEKFAVHYSDSEIKELQRLLSRLQ